MHFALRPLFLQNLFGIQTSHLQYSYTLVLVANVAPNPLNEMGQMSPWLKGESLVVKLQQVSFHFDPTITASMIPKHKGTSSH